MLYFLAGPRGLRVGDPSAAAAAEAADDRLVTDMRRPVGAPAGRSLGLRMRSEPVAAGPRLKAGDEPTPEPDRPRAEGEDMIVTPPGETMPAVEGERREAKEEDAAADTPLRKAAAALDAAPRPVPLAMRLAAGRAAAALGDEASIRSNSSSSAWDEELSEPFEGDCSEAVRR